MNLTLVDDMRVSQMLRPKPLLTFQEIAPKFINPSSSGIRDILQWRSIPPHQYAENIISLFEHWRKDVSVSSVKIASPNSTVVVIDGDLDDHEQQPSLSITDTVAKVLAKKLKGQKRVSTFYFSVPTGLEKQQILLGSNILLNANAGTSTFTHHRSGLHHPL